MSLLTRRQFAAGALSLAGAHEVRAQQARRPQIGFYQWLGVSPRGEQRDLLSQAREQNAALGCALLRLYLGGRYDYVHPVMSPRRFADAEALPRSLTELLELPRYRAVFDEPSLATIILTAYPLVDHGAGPDDINLLRRWGARERDIEQSQTTALCEWLFRNYGEQAKTIVIANAEADEKLREIAGYTGDLAQAAATLAAWMRDRFAAIDAVRRRYPRAKLKVLHAFEISMVHLRVVQDGPRFRKGLAPAPGSRRGSANALEAVVPEIPFDLLSYSSYEAANSPYQTGNTDTPPEAAGGRISRDIEHIRNVCLGNVSSYGRGLFGSNCVMIGEIGFARERFEKLSTGGVLARLDASLEAAASQQCPFLVIWQAFDAPRDGRAAWGFGAFDATGRRPRLRRSHNGAESLADWARITSKKLP